MKRDVCNFEKNTFEMMVCDLEVTVRLLMLGGLASSDRSGFFFRYADPRNAVTGHTAHVMERPSVVLFRFLYFWNYRSSALGRSFT